MSIENQEKYSLETGKKPIYFGKITKEFYNWLNESEENEIVTKLEEEEMEKAVQKVINSEEISIKETIFGKRNLKEWIFNKSKVEMNLKDIRKAVKKAFLTKFGKEYKHEKKYWIENLIILIAKNLRLKEETVRKGIDILINESLILKDNQDQIYYYPEIIGFSNNLNHNEVLDFIHAKKLFNKQKEKRKPNKEKAKRVKQVNLYFKELISAILTNTDIKMKEMNNFQKITYLEDMLNETHYKEYIFIEQFEFENQRDYKTNDGFIRRHYSNWKIKKENEIKKILKLKILEYKKI